MEELLRRLYDAFNARRMDDLLAVMTEDVDWPDVARGERLVGRDAVRAYWEAQLAVGDPRVEPIAIAVDGDVADVTVHQVLKQLDGTVVREGAVHHVYRFRDGKVARMDVRMPA